MTTREAQDELDELIPKVDAALCEFAALTAARDKRLKKLREQTNTAYTEYRDKLYSSSMRLKPLMDRRNDLESFLKLTK